MKAKKWEEMGERFYVAGMQYSDYKKVRAKLRLGAQVRFVGEPSNQYDSWAVKVLIDGTHIGYVPKSEPMKIAMWENHKRGNRVIGVITGASLNIFSHDSVTLQALVLRKSPQSKRKVTKKQADVLFSKMREELSYMVK